MTIYNSHLDLLQELEQFQRKEEGLQNLPSISNTDRMSCVLSNLQSHDAASRYYRRFMRLGVSSMNHSINQATNQLIWCVVWTVEAEDSDRSRVALLRAPLAIDVQSSCSFPFPLTFEIVHLQP